MPNTLYSDPDLGVHRYQLAVEVDDQGQVQALALAQIVLDIGGRPVGAKQNGKDGVEFTVPMPAVTALQALVDAELSGKTQVGKGHIEMWIRNATIETGAGTGPWFHYTEKVAGSGIVPAEDIMRNPVLALDPGPINSIGGAAIGSVNSAIA